jgi:hypothetical protein
MRNLMRSASVLLLGASLVGGCAGPEGPEGQIGAAGSQGAPGIPGGPGSQGQDGEDGSDGVDGDDGVDGQDGDADTDFAFRTDDPSAYVRVDRFGMPAVATALIASASKDAYNESDPVDDVANTFRGEVRGSIDFLHDALDDDLTSIGATPCDPSPAGCYGQTEPAIIPDTQKVDTTLPPGFPNGRMLADPVVDVTLALLLLDLSGPHTAFDLIGTNPTANDKPFMALFPWVPAPH